MKVAIIGSRNVCFIEPDFSPYVPEGVTEIVSGGARGIDTNAREYAQSRGIPYTEFRPDYQRYGRAAPLKRNLQIIDYADYVVAIWDGKSKGTKHVIESCKKRNKKVHVYVVTYLDEDEDLKELEE